ncbi:MAG: hypothetical protein OHK0050_15490 [Roseiflexaceae bacterium]
MTFLGIGPGEFFLLLIILLVVVGPERLPGFARQAGKAIVGLRNWIQRSPDAQLFLRARDELESELQAIRNDLTQEMESVRLEMQTVRQEMIQATREATIDATRQIDTVTAEARDAVQDATVQINKASTQIEQAAEQIEHAAQVVESNPDQARTIVAQAAQQADQAADRAADMVREAVDDQAERSIMPPQLAAANGAPLPPAPVPRSTKPNAYTPPPLPNDHTKVEVEQLKGQVETLTLQLRSLQDQIRELQATLRRPEPAATEATQPEEVA